MSSKTASKTSSKERPGNLTKLSPIPKGARIEKRPLTRQQPPASSKSRIIYVSSKTPFMAIVKRVRKQLDGSLKTSSAANKHASMRDRVEALERGTAEMESALVTVMGTGRAVEKTLAVASWFQQQGDCEVQVTTGTVGTVDDVVVEDEDAEDTSRLRKMSCLRVSIQLK